MAEQQVKSRQRVVDHGEVFTAEREVKAMCDLVKQETERIESRFLEPACGNGNFLAEVLSRKLAVVKSRYGKSPFDYERYSVLAMTSLYGVDIWRITQKNAASGYLTSGTRNIPPMPKPRQTNSAGKRYGLSYVKTFCAEMRSPCSRLTGSPLFCRVEPCYRQSDETP